MIFAGNMTRLIDPAPITKYMLLGGGIALLFVTIFLLGVDKADPVWGKFWMIRPLVIVPLAGAMGGFSYYLLNRLCQNGGWNKPLTFLIGVIIYLIAVWMGTVFGLDGTLWN